MDLRIAFPKQASLTYLDSYLSIVRQVRALEDGTIILDCSQTRELSPLSICFLCGLVDLARNKNLSAKIILSRNKKTAEMLREIKLLSRTPGRPKIKIAEKMLQVRRIDGANSAYFEDMLSALAFHLPISSPAKSSLIFVLNELLTNAIDHSGEKYCYVCIGSWGRSKNIHVALLDFGIGIPNRLRTRYSQYNVDKEAIRAVLEKKLTVREDRLGGMGYELIQNILRANGGRLHILSGKAKIFLKYDRKEYNYREARVPFFGTCIDIQYRLDGPSYYEAIPEISKEYF
ncbi:MAG: ATP-binding protein [bacterium]